MHLDINTYLQPISNQNSCGIDLSFSDIFHDIKKARTQDDLLLEQGDWITEFKQADWTFVAKTSTELFIHKSKDIRLLSWLTEAWSHLHGFSGIASGLELSQLALLNYWENIHPIIENNDLDQRLGLLQGMINQLPTLIKQVPLSTGTHSSTLFDYENFLYQQNIRLKNTTEYNSSTSYLAMEQFEQELNNTAQTVLLKNYQHFQNILQHWQSIKHTLEQLLGINAPSFSSIDSHLESIHINLKKIYKVEQISMSEVPEIVTEITTQATLSQHNMTNIQHLTEQPSQPTPLFQPQTQSHIQNRQQAMQVLQEIADYFARNEPHSPVSYLLEKTIKWSELPLHEWLAQVVKNDNPLESIQEMLGVKTHPHKSNDW